MKKQNKSKFNKLKKRRICPTIIQYKEKPKLSGITPENKPGILQEQTIKRESEASEAKQPETQENILSK